MSGSIPVNAGEQLTRSHSNPSVTYARRNPKNAPRIRHDQRVNRTILLELTADVAALKLGVLAAVKADGLTGGQVSDMMADLTRQMKNRFAEYDVLPDD